MDDNKKHELQQIVAVVNNKGGVGKTTTVQSLAAGIVRFNHNLRVLVVDLDPQCNLSQLMGLQPTECRTVFDAMCEQKGLSIYKCYNSVYAVCGSAQMQYIDQHLPGGATFREMKKAFYVLLECLQSDCIDETGEGIKSLFDDFDYIFIDCPPALSKSTYNALVASSNVLVPVQMESLSVRGLKEIIDVMDEVKEEHLNEDLQMSGLLPVMVDTRTKITKELQTILDERFPDKVLGYGVRRCVKILEAQKCNHTIFDDAPYSTAGIDYEKVVKELYLNNIKL